MSVFKIRTIPTSFKSISWKINFHEMTLIPFLMILINTVNFTMSLSALEMSTLSYAVLGGDIVSFIVVLALFVHNRQLTQYGLLYVLFFMLMLGVTIINSQDIRNCLYTAIYVWLTLFMFRYYRDRIKVIYCSFAIALSFCAYVNFVHLLMHPMLWLTAKDKIGFLLGNNYNQMGCRLLIALVTNIICTRFSKLWTINTIILAAVSIASLAFVGSMTSLSMIILFLLFILIPSQKLRKLSIAGLFTIYVLFQTFVVFSGKGLENNELAVYFVVDVLHKDITFTHRTYMWDCALKTIVSSPIWGWGFVTLEWYKSHMTSFAAGPHNFILSILINGGVLLFSIFLSIAYKSYKAISPYIKERMGQTVIFAAVCLFFMALMEMYPYPIMFYMLILLFYYPYLQKNK